MMARLLASVGPRHIGGQIVVLVLVSVAVFHLVSFGVFRLAGGDGPGRPELAPLAVADRFAEFVRLLDRLQPAVRPEVAALMRETYPAIGLTLIQTGQGPANPPDPAPGDPALEGLLSHLRRVLGPDLPPVPVRDGADLPALDGPPRIAVRLRDGSVALGTLIAMTGPPSRAGPLAVLLGTLGFTALALTALLWWAARGLTAPLSRLARAAEEFSLDRDPAPLPEDGPVEMRATARALNRMRGRIRAMVEDRTRMLAAVGHDLRTPITRMRLRAEFVEDEGVRAPLLRDLDQMGAMVQGALSYLRDGQAPESRSLVDLASFLQTMADDFADMGADVAYEGPDHLLGRIRPDEVRRAVANLVENALTHGGARARIRLREEPGRIVTIEVVDGGPGIPEADRARLLEPFARGDAARGLNGPKAGFGLGLAIARSVAEAHGGTLSLHDPPTPDRPGLLARLRLPVRACDPA